MESVKNIDLETVSQLRNVSQRISQHLSRSLTGYLQSLKPLFLPRKILGEYMDSAFEGRVAGAENNVQDIGKQFKQIANDAFGMPVKLGTPIPAISNDLTITPWQYQHHLSGNEMIVVSSPVRWVITYRGEYGLRDLMEQTLNGDNLNEAGVKDLMIRNLTLCKLLEDTPDIRQLFKDLRFGLSFETNPVSANLPYVVASCDVPSFRPQDEVIKTVVSLSGKAMFEELIDNAELQGMADPFKISLLNLAAE